MVVENSGEFLKYMAQKGGGCGIVSFGLFGTGYEYSKPKNLSKGVVRMCEYTPSGLSALEVEQSLKEHGDNRLTQKKRLGFFRQFLSNFGDPIIKVLLAALAVNVIFLFRGCDWYESIGIAIAVLLATLVSTVSEYGSEAAFEKLQEEAGSVTCRVMRGNRLRALPIEELVVGDVVYLQAGERVPADGILVEGVLKVDQSALNGESRELEKHPAENSSLDSLTSPNGLFRGAVVCSGNGVFVVQRVGDATFYGGVAGEIQEQTRESPLKLRLAGLAGSLSRLGFIAAGCVAFSDLFHLLIMENQYSLPAIFDTISQPSVLLGHLLHAATLAITVVVVAVPEGLPMMITVVLSSNMRRMLKDHVLVRKLVGIETSGSLNILFTDKTGTLTKGKPEVSVFADAMGNVYQTNGEVRRQKPIWELIRLSGYYNTESSVCGKDVLGGNATERALLQYILDRQPLRTDYTVVNRIPFDSTRKWSGVELYGNIPLCDMTSQRLTFIKGAPDKLLSVCNRYVDSKGHVVPLQNHSAVHAAKQNMEKNAMRVLALAITESPLQDTLSPLILIGLVGLRDEVRPEVRKAVHSVKKAGIQVVMMTGDGKETATAIARTAGLIEPNTPANAVITSRELSALSDEQVKQRLPGLRVISRALPTDKSRLVRLSQEVGLVVGMTGDGVNDAPALKRSDVGFAMGSGTEVAKQAGDIVILNDDFASIAKAILYGRTIFKSIRKFIIFQLTMNLCAVGISILGPFIGVEAPVTVIQMLWINIIMDTLAGLAFAGEPPLAEYMNEKPKDRCEPVLNRYMLNQILCTGCFTVGVCVAFLRAPIFKTLFRFNQHPIYWMTAFFALFIFCGIFNSFNARTHRLDLLSHLRKNPAFLGIMSLVTIVQLALIYYGGTLFRTAGLTLRELGMVVLLAALVIPFDALRKCVLRIFHRKGSL